MLLPALMRVRVGVLSGSTRPIMPLKTDFWLHTISPTEFPLSEFSYRDRDTGQVEVVRLE